MGIAQDLIELGIKLIVMEAQKNYINFSDKIFEKDSKCKFKPINTNNKVVLTCAESRNFLSSLGIEGEIIYTPGHSDDSISTSKILLCMYNNHYL